MELVIVQCMDLHSGGKDKLFVEWELPFPHDSPIRGHTEEAKVASASPKFNGTFRVPFTRKLKSSQRAIRNKSLKLDVIVKGGFLRSDKSVGSAQVKLAALDSHCELHTVEELREGRSSVGKIEVYVRLRSPLSESESKKNTERWLFVQHVKRQLAPPQASSSSKKSPSPN
uniref:C2 domain-containing protein n=1 Tax=Ciona savignyi TaxID=51511 RepID=H2Z496_CIOSA